MNLAPEGPMAIPLWINGRAFLTMTESFLDVIDHARGEAIRRVPLCGAAEAAEAAGAARAALAGWSACPAEERLAQLATLADALDQYAGHFARLVAQETGLDEAAAGAEVAAAVAALRTPGEAAPGVVAVLSDAGKPLSGLLGTAAAVIAAGGTVVLKPSAKAPSAAYALCELSARAGWPGGVLNLLQGDEAAVAGLCAHPDIDRLAYAGEAALGARIAAMAAAQGKTCDCR